ncbi:MAG: DJ-1/PfpI family protein [Bacteroidota bacterium]|nr:DJ-1/PfpI family protein [Bacteroidota bacterium]
MKKCYVFLAEGFEETEAITIIDVLRRGQLIVDIVSITGKKEVTGAHGIKVLAEKLFEETSYEDGTMLILPGGMPGSNNLNSHSGLKKLIQSYDEAGKYLGAICAAPLVFGGLGLLKGKEAICYPGFEDRLVGATISDKNTVFAGRVITSKGIISAVEFGLAIVKELQGAEICRNVADGLLVE